MSGAPLVIFAPSPMLTVTIEATGQKQPEIHLHAGGQGFWVAHLAALLGADVTLCCALGGEPGAVLRALMARQQISVRDVEASGPNGTYVHDRRDGERHELARTTAKPLTRHEADELYGITFGAGLDARVVLLTGSDPPDILGSGVYQRLAADLRRNGQTVIADLSGEALTSALSGGLDLLKISEEELIAEGRAASSNQPDVIASLAELHAAGARTVLVSRADKPALAYDGTSGHVLRLTGPQVEAVEPRGAGDSMFAALGATLAEGAEMLEAMRLAMAAGCLNATRHGLGTGTAHEIRELSAHVTVEELEADDRSSDARRRAPRPRPAAVFRGDG
jgi:1-phosphofructokinase